MNFRLATDQTIEAVIYENFTASQLRVLELFRLLRFNIRILYHEAEDITLIQHLREFVPSCATNKDADTAGIRDTLSAVKSHWIRQHHLKEAKLDKFLRYSRYLSDIKINFNLLYGL